MAKLKLVSVVIPNWNGVVYLKTCLPSLKVQTYKNLEVIIVDNGSFDHSIKYIEANFKDIKLIKLNSNHGFAKAVNLGIKKAQGEYIFLLNNDTELDRRCIEFLVTAIERHQDIGFVTSKVLNFYNRQIIDTTGDQLDEVGHLYSKGYGKKDQLKFNKEGYVFLASGGSSLFKKQLFEKVGLFDENFFFYMEDADLCLRAQLLGFKGWYEPNAVVYHIRQGTSKKIKQENEWQVFRNMTMMVIKNYPAALLRHNLNWFKILLVNIHTLWYLIKKGIYLGAFQAEWDVIKNFSYLLKQRKLIQQTKVVDDQYIINNILPKKIW